MTYTVYYDSVITHSFQVEENRGWPLQNERTQYKSFEAAQKRADKLNNQKGK